MIADLKTYAVIEDSGVPWLGEPPELGSESWQLSLPL